MKQIILLTCAEQTGIHTRADKYCIVSRAKAVTRKKGKLPGI